MVVPYCWVCSSEGPLIASLEFAVLAGSRLSTSGLNENLCCLPKRIVEMFYRLRFGDNELDVELESQLLGELAILRTALAENAKSR